MKKWFVLLVGLVAASALTVQSADAHGKKKVGKGVVVAGVVTGAAATATYFGINHWRWKWDSSQSQNGFTQGGAYVATTIGCMAISPMLASAFEGRELTLREAHVLFASCLIPIVGGYLENALWDANPQWQKYEKKPKRFAKPLF